jgi:hypothetical protein
MLLLPRCLAQKRLHGIAVVSFANSPLAPYSMHRNSALENLASSAERGAGEC